MKKLYASLASHTIADFIVCPSNLLVVAHREGDVTLFDSSNLKQRGESITYEREIVPLNDGFLTVQTLHNGGSAAWRYMIRNTLENYPMGGNISE